MLPAESHRIAPPALTPSTVLFFRKPCGCQMPDGDNVSGGNVAYCSAHEQDPVAGMVRRQSLRTVLINLLSQRFYNRRLFRLEELQSVRAVMGGIRQACGCVELTEYHGFDVGGNGRQATAQYSICEQHQRVVNNIPGEHLMLRSGHCEQCLMVCTPQGGTAWTERFVACNYHSVAHHEEWDMFQQVRRDLQNRQIEPNGQ